MKVLEHDDATMLAKMVTASNGRSSLRKSIQRVLQAAAHWTDQLASEMPTMLPDGLLHGEFSKYDNLVAQFSSTTVKRCVRFSSTTDMILSHCILAVLKVGLHASLIHTLMS
jgi:hypothetical protein